MRTLKSVCFITTVNHNVGDDFVREGILYLIEKKFGPVTASLIHKHIPLTARPEWEWFHAKGFSRIFDTLPMIKGLFWSRLIDSLPLNPETDKVLSSDLLVQSGAPVYWGGAHDSEWYGPLIRRRYERIKDRVPFVNIGAGACYPYHCNVDEIIRAPLFADYVKELHAAAAVTTVRDSLSKKILNSMGLDAPVIPCPSIFAADRLTISPGEPEYVVLNYMPLGGHYDFNREVDSEKWERTFVSLYDAASKETPVLIVCHDAIELRHARRLLPEAAIFFGSTAAEYLECYSRAKCFVGNRVHGAYAVASIGRPAFVVGNDSRALMMEEIGLQSIFVNDANLDTLLLWIQEMEGRRGSYSDEMQSIKSKALGNYLKSLSALDDCGGEGREYTR